MPIVLPTNADTDLYDVQIENGGTTLTFGVPLGGVGELIGTFYFDASDSGPTDTGGDWTDDASAFDGNESTFATTPTLARFLSAAGTNAPSSGLTIGKVIARHFDENGWGERFPLDAPSGGWTWAKVQALYLRLNSTNIPAVRALIYESDGGALLGDNTFIVDATSAYRSYRTEISVFSDATNDDHLLILATGDDDDISWTPPTNFVEFFEVNNATNDDASVGAWYAKASDITTLTVDLVRSGAEEQVGVMMVVQGADLTDFEDLAFSEGTHFVATNNVDGTPNVTPQEIITATDDAVVIILTGNRSDTNHWGGSGTTWDVDPPTGYTIESATNVASNNTAGAPGRLKQGEGAGDAMFTWMWKTVTSAGTETPGQITGFTGGRDHLTVTFAIRPASVSGDQNLTPTGATVTVSAGSLTVTTGPVAVTPTGATVTVTPSGLTVTQVTNITPTGASVSVAAGGLTITTGPVSVTPAGATVTATAGGLTVTTRTDLTPSGATVTVTPAGLTISVGPADLTPAGASVGITAGSLTITVGSASLTPAGASVTVTPSELTVTTRTDLALTGATITATPSGLTITVGPADITLTGATVSATPGGLTVTRVQNVTPTGATVSVTAGGITITTGPVGITPSGASVSVTPAALTVSTRTDLTPSSATVTITPAGLTVTVGAADLTLTGATVGVTAGTLAVSLTGAAPQDLTLTGATVTVTSAALTVSTRTDLTPAGASVSVTPAGLTITTGPADVTPAGATVTVTPSGLTVTTGAVAVTPSGATVSVSPANLTISTRIDLTPDGATVTVAPAGLTITVGSVPIVPTGATVTITAGTVTVVAFAAVTKGFVTMTDSGDQAAISDSVSGASSTQTVTGAATSDSAQGASMTDAGKGVVVSTDR